MAGKFLYNNRILRERRKVLRKNQTDAEKLLWFHIRNQKLDGHKFFRQYSAGPYILDFYCPEIRLAIELDGGQHTEEGQRVYDKERSVYLVGLDIKTVRFWNSSILRNIDSVLEVISKNIAERGELFPRITPSISPLH